MIFVGICFECKRFYHDLFLHSETFLSVPMVLVGDVFVVALVFR